jgi:hypothetical protein
MEFSFGPQRVSGPSFAGSREEAQYWHLRSSPRTALSRRFGKIDSTPRSTVLQSPGGRFDLVTPPRTAQQPRRATTGCEQA